MAASTEKHDAMPNPQFDERLCEIEATCTTGFEEVVQNDLEEKLGAKVIPAKGKVTVFVPFKDVTKVGSSVKIGLAHVSTAATGTWPREWCRLEQAWSLMDRPATVSVKWGRVSTGFSQSMSEWQLYTVVGREQRVQVGEHSH